MNMMETVPGRVRRRHAFFIPGYDPRGARFYYKLYKDEAPKQNALNRLNVEVGPRERAGEFESRCRVTATDDLGPIETTYHFLLWDDLVRARWARSLFGVYGNIWRAFWALLFHGVYLHSLVTSWPMFVTGIYPVGFMAAHFLIAAMVGGAAGYAVSLAFGLIAGIVAGLIVAASLFTFGKMLEERYNSLWLGRIILFIADQGRGRTAEVERRCADFAGIIAAAADEEGCDEILIIGHSIGSHLALSTLARGLDRDPELTTKGPIFSLLTLGHMIPTVAVQRRAGAFREDLKRVAGEESIEWIDMTSPIDGATMPLTDPVTASRLPQPNPATPRPKLLNPRFHKLFTPATYAEIRRRFKRAHLQYMMASELAGDYDFFAITAGPLTLEERYRAHPSVANFNRFRWGVS
jgi:pimeloyl-ACP methyl ester carboxylesterase